MINDIIIVIMVDIISKFEDSLKGDLPGSLYAGEIILDHTLAAWQRKRFSILTVDVFITNQRLVVANNTRTVQLSGAAGAVGGGLGGGMAGAVGGAVGGAAATSGGDDDSFELPLTNITSITPGKYQFLGFLPTTNTAVTIGSNSDARPYVLLIQHRDTWLEKLNQARNLALVSGGSSGSSI